MVNRKACGESHPFSRALRCCYAGVVALVLAACGGSPSSDERVGARDQPLISAANVLTQHNDISRTGVQRAEAIITPASVNYDNFGPLYSRYVNGMMFAQPLYLEGVGGDVAKNYVYVATSENDLYAFDARSEGTSPTSGVALHRQLSTPAARGAFPNAGGGFLEGTTNIGILSTPTIDASTNTIYVVSADGSAGGVKWRLYALDAATLEAKYSAQPSLEITGSVTGKVGVAPGSNGTITFQPGKQISRSGLLVMGSGATTRIFAGFAGFGDAAPYHGWVFKFIDNNCTPRSSCQGLTISAVQNTTPHETFNSGDAGRPEGGGGLWQSGNGIAGDDVNNLLYFVTGNATPRGGTCGTTPYGSDSIDNGVAQLNALTLGITGKWLPPNYGQLQCSDTDFGSGGALL